MLNNEIYLPTKYKHPYKIKKDPTRQRVIENLLSFLNKQDKIYFQPEKGEKPPRGSEVEEGPKGGKFYISEGVREKELEIDPLTLSEIFGYKSINIKRVNPNRIKESLIEFSKLNERLHKIFPNIQIIKKDLDIIIMEYLPDYRKAGALYQVKGKDHQILSKQILLGSTFKQLFYHELGHYLVDSGRIRPEIYNNIIKQIKDHYKEIDLQNIYKQQVKEFDEIPNATLQTSRQFKKLLDDQLKHDLKDEEMFCDFFNSYVWAKLKEDNPKIPLEYHSFKMILSKMIIPPEKVLEIAGKSDFSISKMLNNELELIKSKIEKLNAFPQLGPKKPEAEQDIDVPINIPEKVISRKEALDRPEQKVIVQKSKFQEILKELENNYEEKLEKDFPGDVEGEQRHSQYEDLLVGKSPKLGEHQKEIIGKASFSPNAPKTSTDQKEKDQSYKEENQGGEHIGNVFQLSSNSSKPLETNKKAPDLNVLNVEKPIQNDELKEDEKEQELTEGEIRLLAEIDKYLANLEKD